MQYARIFLGWIWLVAFPAVLSAQHITYSEADREDMRQLRFDILGRIGNTYMVYKNTRSKHFITVYDQDMKVVKNTDLDALNDRLINVDFVSYTDFAYMIYQYQKRGIVYCMAQQIGPDGTVRGEPQLLDTTNIGIFGDNKIYSTIASEDKSKIMIFKIKGKSSDYLTFTTILLGRNLEMEKKSRFVFRVEQHRDLLTDFYVNNDGDFIFARCERASTRDNILHVTLAMKPATGDSLQTMPIDFGNIFLDEVKLKVDNFHQRILVSSFYSGNRRGNVDGLFVSIVDKTGAVPPKSDTIAFGQDLRARAKGENSVKGAFNDFFIKHVIITGNEGFLVTAESEYSTSRGYPFNRYDYLYGANPYFYPNYDYYYYSPWSNYGWSPFYRYGYYQPVRYYADNIALFALDKDGKLTWSNIIPKSQYDDDEDSRLSFQIMLQGGALHFLYNEWNRRTPILSDDSVTPDGQLTRQEPLHNLDRGYEFLIRYAQQVSASQMIVPCTYRNSIAFALIDFDASTP
ncbi:hypothetical protein [Dinghuibacter silviterrae]|uniref:Uncharacterized protein n=1 Tax=Dinghuibacter silviterrae TaxID=1539049 RepID=A0A4R8DQQ2_9BACT|nr:hypothetical protein [Dinghuibacter silviterrae]TDX00269.1 hypothetical protein EDB95_1288 [Dinghuibacter silviterrae]